MSWVTGMAGWTREMASRAAGAISCLGMTDWTTGREWLGCAGNCPPLPEICELIERSIAPEPVGSPGEGNVIREGFSPELDALKHDSQNARSFIAGLEQTERERTGLRGLKIGYNQVFGYYIEVSKSNQAQVPDNYIRRQTLVSSERYVTPEIKEYESLVLNARERIDEMERSLFRQVCEQVTETGDTISRLAKAVAMVDVFVSLAEVAAANGYVRPQLDLNRTISIKNGRHPVLERLLDRGTYVPNDVYLSNDDARIILLTGPNMAGKSTFIRQAAIIVLMAQVGSYVPASEAIVGLVDRIFTRVGLQDDLTTGQSTFMVEMVETAAHTEPSYPPVAGRAGRDWTGHQHLRRAVHRPLRHRAPAQRRTLGMQDPVRHPLPRADRTGRHPSRGAQLHRRRD